MEARSLTPFPNIPRRRGFLRRPPARAVTVLCLLGTAGILWQSSASDSSPDRQRPRRGLRNALTSAAQTSSSSQRLLGSAKASTPEPLLPPPDLPPQPAGPRSGLMEKVSSLSILSEDWVLSSDRAQQLGFSAQKTKELNEFLARMRGRICEEQSSRMNVTIQENGCTLITIPEFDGRKLRDRLQMGITAIAGRAANAILKAVEARADADFAGIGASSMELQFANIGTESAPRYRVMRTITYREPGKAPAGPPRHWRMRSPWGALRTPPSIWSQVTRSM
ncbi:MAG TPA: hypothetical protein VG796_05745 [Verrucomicrobiales bacterium]|nr:hypothetical protein [Verrucomicrobiales bacterium]